jgi:hypothetical protein
VAVNKNNQYTHFKQTLSGTLDAVGDELVHRHRSEWVISYNILHTVHTKELKTIWVGKAKSKAISLQAWTGP